MTKASAPRLRASTACSSVTEPESITIAISGFSLSFSRISRPPMSGRLTSNIAALNSSDQAASRASSAQ